MESGEESKSDIFNLGRKSFDMFSSKSNTEMLIKLIRSHPELWDRTSGAYRDKEVKDKAWDKIAKMVYPEYLTANKSMKIEILRRVITRWYNVRDCYVKCMKRGNGSKKKRYLYADYLTFLDPTYDIATENQQTDEFEHLEGFTEAQIIEANDDTQIGDETEVNVTEHNMEEEYLDMCMTDPVVNSAKRQKTDPLDENVVSVLVSLLEKEEDEDRAFFKSITPAVKEMSSDTKMEFKIKVLKLIRDLNKKQKFKVEKDKDSTDSEY